MKLSKAQLRKIIRETRWSDQEPDPELTKKVLSELDDLVRLVRGGHVKQGDLDYIDGEIVDILNRVFSQTMVFKR